MQQRVHISLENFTFVRNFSATVLLIFDEAATMQEVDNFTISANSSLNVFDFNFSVVSSSKSYLPSTSSYDATDWGPKRDPLQIVIPITILYVVIFLTGLIGNICTCMVIARNKCMHTATNYYLFSLAVSDLLLLVSGLPTEIYSTWSKYPYIFGEEFCILQGFAAETSANATVLTITAFTMERYVAICHPFLSHTLSKLSRAIKFIIVIWIVAMCLALPQAMAFGLVYELSPNGDPIDHDHCVCTVKRLIIPHAFEISTFLFFIAPMSLITILYILIGLQIRNSVVGPTRTDSIRLKHTVTKPVGAYITNNQQTVLIVESNENEKHHLTREKEEGRKNYPRNAAASKHVVKMLVAVVVAFFICWAPFHAQRLLAIYGQPNSSHMIATFRILTYISGVFYYLSTTINPLLYHIMSHKFRVAFKDTLIRIVKRKHRQPGTRLYSALSARSSQVNSHSNTDSYSRNSLRYLETEMKRLQESRRPLVVSFKRKRPQTVTCLKQVTILDIELQNALDSLQQEKSRLGLKNSCSSNSKHTVPILKSIDSNRPPTDYNHFDPQPLGCPLHPNDTCKSISHIDIEVFQDQHLKMGNTKRGCGMVQFGGEHSRRLSPEQCCSRRCECTSLKKSCTMPLMVELANKSTTGDKFYTDITFTDKDSTYALKGLVKSKKRIS